MLFSKKANLLENLNHVNIVDKWARIQGFTCNDSDCLYLSDKIRQYFPEYRDQDLLELSDQVKQILVCANGII